MRIRIKLRWVMLLVALIAVAVGPAWRYAQELRMRSQYYDFCVGIADGNRQLCLREAGSSALDPEEREYLRREAAWHAARSARFKRGVHRPWLDITEPEPLPPRPPKAPPAAKEAAFDKALAALSGLKDKMSPEQYATIREKLRDLNRMSEDMDRRVAERRQARSRQRMGEFPRTFTPKSPPPVSISTEIMAP